MENFLKDKVYKKLQKIYIHYLIQFSKRKNYQKHNLLMYIMATKF